MPESSSAWRMAFCPAAPIPNSLLERVIVDRQMKADGSTDYVIREKYRVPSILWLAVFYIVLIHDEA